MCTPRSAAVVFGALVGVALGLVVPVASARATPSAEALIDPGAGWTLVDEQPGAQESLIRTYQSDAAFLLLTAIPVTTPPGVRSTFEFFTSMEGFEAVPEGSLDLAAWAVEPGTQLDNGVSAELTFAARDFIFIFAAQTDGSVDPVALLRDLAQRQVSAAGGPAAAEIATPERSADESQLVAMLPAAPPDGYDLSMGSTATGSDELTAEDDVNIEVAQFLNDNSVTATRVWASTELAGAVSITRFPYDIFAAAAVHEATHGEGAVVISDDALPDAPDVVTFRDGSEGGDQIGSAFRRGDLFVLVLTQRTADVPDETALALATDLSRLTIDALPAGGTTPYEFPSAPSKVLVVALTAAIVAAAACGSALIARLRARRVRRKWEGGELPSPEVGDSLRWGTAIALDDEAQ
ncbi:MAG TPA: hypothetical protein VE487_09095, partial [Ilumatobacter sp.]|nr:hypothetical protein [Ilumatobacter sp.]